MFVKIFREDEIVDYELFLEKHPLATVTQCTKWGEFQAQLPARGKVWRIGVYDGGESEKGDAAGESGGDGGDGDDVGRLDSGRGKKSPGIFGGTKFGGVNNPKLVATCLVVRHKLPKGYCWLYSQGGPVGNYEHGGGKWLDLLKKEIAKIAKVENAVFWRISPTLILSNKKKYTIKGFKKAHAHYQPESTLKIDLTRGEEEILAGMKPKGRYNIKVAKKHGVTVRFSDGSDGDIENFYKILKVTTERDGFSPHDFEFYMRMMKTLALTGNAELVLAEAGGEILCGAIVTYFGETATYYYGASSNKMRNFMAPYLLQWEAMRRAKKRGFKVYDFLGIAPEGAKNHPWEKVTEFKMKFGGERVNYAAEMETVFKPVVYAGVRLVKALRGK